ncbi:hypothetical protein [Bradyrhizobium sp. AZCC 2289]|uniref:hypothetical protein n=1 Tax=Bradyrhizobium sp. AZCC 2289 TaxID=3117026 RepID=UPI002FF43B8F
MYDLYKPLRNYLRKHELFSGLKAVYYYFQFLQFDVALPRELQHPELSLRPPYDLGLFEWELQTLTREMLLNCAEDVGHSLFSWKAIAAANNKIKHIENETWGLLAKEGDISFEMARIANRQFHWQLGMNQPTISRYFRIANHHLIRPMVIDEFGMTPEEMFQIGVSLSGHFLGQAVLKTPISNEVNSVSPEKCAAFLVRFCRTLTEHKALARSAQTYDINWAYNFNSLEEFPLIRISEHQILCPIPTMLLRRFCDGLYFDLVRRGNEFHPTFGLAYEDYVGDVSSAANIRGTFQILKAERYGPRTARKDTIDWLLFDDSATLFIECKASRVRLQAKVDLLARESIYIELRKLAGFIVQTYATLSDALHGQYESWKPAGTPVYPFIVTLDNWQRFGLIINDAISENVKAAFDEKGLDQNLLAEHPYTLCAIEEFEQAIQIMAVVGIDNFMSKKIIGEQARWELVTFITRFFEAEAVEHTKALFGLEFAALEKGNGSTKP